MTDVEPTVDVEALRERVGELEALESEHRRSEQVQAALYRIAETASAAQDMHEFYAEIHRIVGALMFANNFYVVLYDEERRMMSWPFGVDGAGDTFPDPNVWEPMGTGEARGLTAYVLRKGSPMLLSWPDIQELIRRKEVDPLGLPSVDWLGVPLRSDGRTVGAMVVQSYEGDTPHTERDKELLTFVASHIGSALSRARAIEETRQRSAELALVNDVQRGLAEKLDMQAMYDLVGDRIQEIFDAQVVDIGIIDASSGLIHFPYTIERGVRFPDEPIQVIGLRRVAIASREPVVVNEDIERISTEAGQPYVLAGEPPKSSVFVPLVVGDEAKGVISLQNLDREHAFSDADVRLLTTLAGSLSVALENARLFEETRQRNAELALINDVQRGLAENLEMQAMYDLVGDRIQQIFDAQVLDIGVLDRAAGVIRYPYTLERGVRLPDEPTPLDAGPGAHVLETREPLLINERFADRVAELGGGFIQGEPPMSALYVPLVIGGEATGRISLQNLDREHAFSDADVRLLRTLAGSLSVALENARLFEETRQRNAELALINDVQRGLVENLDTQAMYDLVGDRIQEIFDAQVVDIAVLDLSSGLVRFPYVIERGVRLDEDPIALIGHRRIAIETREPVLINEDLVAKSEEVGQPAVLSGEVPKAAVFVPLLVGDRATGLISLQNLDREHAFSEGDVRLLMTLAGSLSVALENARLFEETRQRAAELALINDVQRGLAEKLDMQAMYDLVGDRSKQIFDAQTVDISVVDREADMLWFPYSLERGVRLIDHPIEIMGFRRIALETREPVVVNEDMEARCEEAGNPMAIAGEPSKSSLFVPLVVGDRGTGVLSLHNLDRQRAAELSIVNSVGQAFADQLDLDALIERLGDQLRDVFAADIVYVALHDEATDLIEFAYYIENGERDAARAMQFGEGLTSRILREREPLLLNRAEAFEEVGVQIVGTPARSYLGVPILVAGRAIGVISVQSTQQAGRFGESDTRLVSTIAANVGAAIQNARL